MRYPSSSLAVDETIAFDVHHHPVVLFKPFALLLVYLAAWLTLVAEVRFFQEDWVLLGGFALLVLLAAYDAWEVVVFTHVNLVLTDRRLVYQSGVFTRTSREIPLSRINDVTLLQMVLARLFGSGDLVIDSGADSGQWALFDLPKPGTLKLQILDGAHAARGGPGDEKAIALEVARAVNREQPTIELPPLPPERPPLYSEIVDQIERLEAMRERGVISGAEFEEAKRGLLSRLNKEPEV